MSANRSKVYLLDRVVEVIRPLRLRNVLLEQEQGLEASVEV